MTRLNNRKIIDNVRGEINKRQWIIFDGDVDPEWVENLNSVLDDNKLLTLPNGERLSLPPNVRIMFEVQDLKYATLATVSRCGMVWFSEDVLSTEMIFENYLSRLRNIPLEDSDDDNVGGNKGGQDKEDELSPCLTVSIILLVARWCHLLCRLVLLIFFINISGSTRYCRSIAIVLYR